MVEMTRDALLNGVVVQALGEGKRNIERRKIKVKEMTIEEGLDATSREIVWKRVDQTRVFIVIVDSVLKRRALGVKASNLRRRKSAKNNRTKRPKKALESV